MNQPYLADRSEGTQSNPGELGQYALDGYFTNR
jgi:hypothetical protein